MTANLCLAFLMFKGCKTKESKDSTSEWAPNILGNARKSVKKGRSGNLAPTGCDLKFLALTAECVDFSGAIWRLLRLAGIAGLEIGEPPGVGLVPPTP